MTNDEKIDKAYELANRILRMLCEEQRPYKEGQMALRLVFDRLDKVMENELWHLPIAKSIIVKPSLIEWSEGNSVELTSQRLMSYG